jgi:hypothetical protein
MWPLLVTMLGSMISADGELDAPVEDVRAALLDYAEHPRMLPAIAESDVLERRFDELTVHQRIHLPLLRDRDATLRVRWEQDGAGWTIRFDAEERQPPMRGDAVRLAQYSGLWRLDPAREGRATRVRLAATIDFGGNVPRGLARRGFACELPKLLAGIERLAQEKRSGRERASCPSGVIGASTAIADVDGGVQILVTADDEPAQLEIRRLAGVRAQEKREGSFDPSERFASCPGLTPATLLFATDRPGGVELVVRPFDASDLERLRAITRELVRPFQAETNRISRASKGRRVIF